MKDISLLRFPLGITICVERSIRSPGRTLVNRTCSALEDCVTDFYDYHMELPSGATTFPGTTRFRRRQTNGKIELERIKR